MRGLYTQISTGKANHCYNKQLRDYAALGALGWKTKEGSGQGFKLQ